MERGGNIDDNIILSSYECDFSRQFDLDLFARGHGCVCKRDIDGVAARDIYRRRHFPVASTWTRF
jgi:hypothetical protein